ncbi:MAG: adenosylhomocysteinase [Ruminococcaceae bacterium]|nr:adenosylhomocysteinase [Oscillospiraceae bacterium]
MSRIKDIRLAPSGAEKIAWVASYMPILNAIKEEFERTKPFSGMKISMSIHLEAKTAYLAKILRAGGAEVWVTGCNPLSTQDDVAAALAAEGFEVHAKHGVTEEEYRADLISTLSCIPDLIIDDGGDLISLLHGECRELGAHLIGGCEETTTGVHRLLARERAGLLDYTMIDVNDADCKHLFDNRYGTGQSTLDGIMNSTNLIIAGKTVVVAGYGWCGKGLAMRAKGMGAVVIVTEIDPIKAIEAVMDGFRVMPMDEAAKHGDIFVTLTGCKDVLVERHFAVMKDGVLLSNSGHFDVEINKPELEAMAVESFERKPNIRGYRMPDGRILNLLAEGRLVNLAAGNGHPAEIMDMSFGIQAKSLAYLAAHGKSMERRVYAVPLEIDREVANIKLGAMDISIDRLTEEQEDYLARVE